ncbi:non-ribosomal peptide synthase protein (TIGR01720 family)/amino acid adenylation domain-containing protein [Neolewinella xylanilytica]|uniref:Non-ribosomal peptide synthase protein (TIGR01720 family)/amino acid adenylation domain-containing protein n=1 Tax=Neolewinella xylanilytica TaxID=1514080 RepID=A0A2S6I284_9BACT|nr:non-ribosomal peptide synthetase [Neolewinella xylanilytica]PPK85263.1 non-ribosomal peptide synthase protein (TIGR01720 family)/amino acid adenylation domain-containing protein [Neolewinella xylanilytica]
MSKSSLLSKWLNRKKTSVDPPPESAALTGDYPASAGQQRLWVLSELAPDNPFYHYAEQYRIRGAVDVAMLQRSFTIVFARHEILRTTFYGTESGVRQRVTPGPGFSWEYHPAPLAEAEILARAKRPFDLRNGPLTRIRLVRLDADDHLLMVSQHHIITDKQSMRILCEEVAAAYTALRRGEPVDGTPIPQQYGQFASRQLGEVSDTSLRYWQRQLADAPAMLDLPTDYTRPAQQSYRGQYAEASLSAAVTRAIRERSREASVTPYVYLLSAYLVLLYRYSGQADLLVGTPVSNRDSVEQERLIGFFNETLVVRNVLRPDMPFSHLVAEVQKTVLEAFAHKKVAFDAVVKALNPERRAGANPLFQSMFILHKVPEPMELEPGVQLESRSLDLGVTKFDLTLYVADQAECFTYIFEYATDLFTAERIERMLGHFARIVQQVGKSPSVPVGTIQLLTAAEWPAAPEPALPTPDLVDRQILDIAARHPERVAVSGGGQALTYADLSDRSFALARHLHRRGVRSGDIVGLQVDRSVYAIVGILGILRAGAAYLPLDPAYPEARRRFMISDSGASLIVTGADIADLDLTDTGPLPTVDRDADEPAYLIYTSGSSGQPKGIQVSHRNLAYSNAARWEVYGGAPQAFLLLSSFSFDSSVAGIFWTLCGGGKLVISGERSEQDPMALGNLIRRESVSHTLLLPTLYRQLLEFAEPRQLGSLSTVIVAGEACTPATVARHFERLPAASLYNEYGPTEATVWATVHRIRAGANEGPVPIGEAIPHYQVYLIDGNGQLVPEGVVGEIVIGGAGLTAGYWNRPELTAERFTTLSLPDGRCPRVYRTGDLGQQRQDGAIMYLGRQDRQVKIRGYRVELGEVGRQLLEHPAVREAEVVVSPAGSQLIAYVVGSEAIDTDALTDWLRDRTPAHQLPSRLEVMDALPRLPNGKVDVRKLAETAPDRNEPVTEGQTPPANDTEAALLGIWREVLGQERIGVTDNFFSLGGDSILSIRILSRARQAGIELPATAIFDRQTIRELATVAIQAERAMDADRDYSGPVPLTPIQHWFFAEHRSAPHHWNHGWWIEPVEETAIDRIREAVGQLYDRHDALRQQFFRSPTGEWTARTAPAGVTVPFERRRVGEPDLADALHRFQDGIDLDRDPLFRVIVFEGADAFRVLVWAHHLVVDMVSWDVILPSLTGQRDAGGTPYHYWADQLTTWARTGKFEGERGFWESQQGGAIRTDLSGQLPVRQSSVETVEARVSASVTAALLQNANDAYGTRPEELLMTAMLRVTRPWFDGPDQCINLERHGREPLDGGLAVGETLGWFTTAYPLTYRLSGTDIGKDIVAVKETFRAVPSQGIGYGVLRYLAGYEELRQQPALYFNYLGQAGLGKPHGTPPPRFVAEGLRSPRGEVNRVWEINARVEDGELVFTWSFSHALHHRATVVALCNELAKAVETIVQYCQSREQQQFTPSDFPEASLSQDDLEGLLGQLDVE